MTTTADKPSTTSVRGGLLERLKNGSVICAEGYLFELERRGYLQAGAFVPEAVIENPEVVKRLHEDFVHAGSDVVEGLHLLRPSPEAEGHRPREHSGGYEPPGPQDRKGRSPIATAA